jgi:hypothetical protein
MTGMSNSIAAARMPPTMISVMDVPMRMAPSWHAAAAHCRCVGEAEVAQAREGLDWTRRVSS